MTSSQTFLLLLSAAVTGSQSVFNMSVGEQVHTMKGHNVVLVCSFTHPKLKSYSGRITVQWIARDASHPPFFSCNIKNFSDAEVSSCSSPEQKYALAGDPRQGALSLLIRDVALTDEGWYVCRVELEGEGDTSRRVQLTVGGKPQILSLKELNRTRTGPSLECVVEGNPLPAVSWWSQSKHQLLDPIDRKQTELHQVTSWVSYDLGDRVTCQAKNDLGQAEQTYPPESSLVLMVSMCVAGVLLLLLLLLMFGLIVCWRRNRAPPDAAQVYENPNEAQKYVASRPDPEQSECFYELVQPVTTAGDLDSMHGRCVVSAGVRKTSSSAGEPEGVYYSTVKMSE